MASPQLGMWALRHRDQQIRNTPPSTGSTMLIQIQVQDSPSKTPFALFLFKINMIASFLNFPRWRKKVPCLLRSALGSLPPGTHTILTWNITTLWRCVGRLVEATATEWLSCPEWRPEAGSTALCRPRWAPRQSAAHSGYSNRPQDAHTDASFLSKVTEPGSLHTHPQPSLQR